MFHSNPLQWNHIHSNHTYYTRSLSLSMDREREKDLSIAWTHTSWKFKWNFRLFTNRCTALTIQLHQSGNNYLNIYTWKRIETVAVPCTAYKPFNLGEQKKTNALHSFTTSKLLGHFYFVAFSKFISPCSLFTLANHTQFPRYDSM